METPEELDALATGGYAGGWHFYNLMVYLRNTVTPGRTSGNLPVAHQTDAGWTSTQEFTVTASTIQVIILWYTSSPGR